MAKFKTYKRYGRSKSSRPSGGKYSSRSRSVNGRKKTVPLRAKASRFAKASAARGVVRQTAKNTSTVRRNTRLIRQIQNNQFGPWQTQTVQNSASFTVIAHQPVGIHLNNCHHGSLGPKAMYCTSDTNGVGTSLQNACHFTVVTPQMFDPRGRDAETHIVANGPRLLLGGMELKFQFKGFLDHTHIDIWIVQERYPTSKYNAQDPWNKASLPQVPHLPNTIPQFKDLSGFTPQRINHKYVKVLKRRRIYFNSKGAFNPADTRAEAADSGQQATTPATTSSEKTCTIKLNNLNQVIEQITKSTGDHIGAYDDTHMSTHSDLNSSWRYDNIVPWKNIWAVLTTDDQTTFGSSLDGDAVSVDMIMRRWWRDTAA